MKLEGIQIKKQGTKRVGGGGQVVVRKTKWVANKE